MPVKIRLQRFGKKGHPYFHIVAADSRAPRDGKYIERLGSYNPNTNPATIEVDIDGAVRWLGHGAQPTDTARAILSYKGVMYKNHLLKGVKKGALTEEEAEKRFETWKQEKEEKIAAKRTAVTDKSAKAEADRKKAEAEVNQARIAALAAAEAPPVEETPEAAEATDTPSEQTAEAKEEPKAEATEEPKAEAKPEAKEEPKAEAKPEAKEEPKAEAKPEAKEEPKAEAKPETKEEPKAEAKEEPKEEPKAEDKGDAEGESKEEPKAEGKPEAEEEKK